MLLSGTLLAIRHIACGSPILWCFAQSVASKIRKLRLIGKHQPNGPAEVQCEYFGPISGLNFGRWILRGEFLEGEFFRGPLLLEKKSKNSAQEFGSKIRASKIRSPEFGPKFGFRRCKIPCADFCPWENRTRPESENRKISFSEFVPGFENSCLPDA